MPHAKDKHYWAQLRAALTAGQWSSEFPAKDPNGSQLSWFNVLRKFKKHCTGFEDVAEVASLTRTLCSWLGTNSDDMDQLGLECEDQLVLEHECQLSPEWIEEAESSYEKLTRLDSKTFNSIQFALAFYAYALGRPSECLSHLSKVPKLLDAQNHIPPSSTVRSDNSALQAHASLPDTSSSWTGSFISADSSVSIADIKDGRAWAMTESIRSICLQGMCYEKLSEPEKAIQAYSSTLPLLSLLESEIPLTITITHPSSVSFDDYRELWRWTERLMFRVISLLSRVRSLDDKHDLLWTMFTHYHACSAHWPVTFRTSHRSIVAVLHLRALIIRFQTSTTSIPSSQIQSSKPHTWLSTARSVINEYQTILDSCTSFPKAGERNNKVEDFVDLSVAVWETSGATPGRVRWVLDILWWATRLTFNSYRIYRHMSRLLSISGDTELAKRTLRLYTQVVSKAREARVDNDFDTDRHWVETLINGARMLCRLAISRSDDIDDAKEAGEMIERAKTRLDDDDKEMVARVSLAEGVWYTTLAIIEQDPHTRPSRLSHALAAYLNSVDAYPTPAAHHQLAIALAFPGSSQNLDEAIVSARFAVEGEAGETRHWHLLGLLLSANGEWEKAVSILEVGADLGESKEDTESPAKPDVVPNASGLVEKSPMANGIHSKDFERDQPQKQVNGHSKLNGVDDPIPDYKWLLDANAITVPPSATLLKPLPDHPFPSSCDAFEYALQLRMTQMAVAEHVEGPEGAEGRWVDVFGWIAERKSPCAPGSMSEMQPRLSIDTSTGTRTATTRTHSVLHRPSREPLNEKGPTLDQRGTLGLSDGQYGFRSSQPPPITITPATPAEPNCHFPLNMDEKESMQDRPSTSTDGAGKKVHQILKARVHKGQEKISTISRKLGHGVVRSGSLHLKRASSAPDFHAVLQNHHYQASSIHSRRRLGSLIRHSTAATSPTESPPAPPPSLPHVPEETPKPHATKEDKLVSDLWAMSAATFRRLGKIEQTRGAIQEAEVKDPENPAVWVQLGLYYMAQDHKREALEAFQKALFIAPEDIAASVHLCRIHLSTKSSTGVVASDKVDLVAGLLGYVTRGPGWDVPEAWYYLAKAYGLQGRKDKERESLATALALSDCRSIRDIGRAIGWCL